MSEHAVFQLMAFGPAVLACFGALLLVVRWFAERDERKKNVEVNDKQHKLVTAVGLLLILPGLFLLLGKLTVMLRPR